MDLTTLDKLCDNYRDEQGAIVELLQIIQAEDQYIPKETLRHVSEQLDIPLSQLYGLATFYRAFSLEPRGKRQVTCCMGTACHVRGAKRVVDQFKHVLGIEVGDTTDDGLFSLQTVNCVGACAVSPIVMIDDEYHGEMTPAKVMRLVERCRSEMGEDSDAGT